MITGPSILFRCDGSPEIGLGHVVRCLALADKLKDAHRCQVAFAMRSGPLGIEMALKKGYQVFKSPENGKLFDYAQWLMTTVDTIGAQALVLDIRDDLSREAIKKMRRQDIQIVILDDPSDRRLAADLAFYPPVPQIQRLDWTDFTGELYVGWEWVVLRQEFSRRLSRMHNERQIVLVTMGGSDPAGMTIKAVESLNMLEEDFETIVVLGRGFCHHKALKNMLARTCRHFHLRQNVVDMAGLMAKADLAVASFGVTAFELAAMGIPAIYLCMTEDHAESASAFVKAGMGVCLGMFNEVTNQMLAEKVRLLLINKQRRLQMAELAKQKMNGQGTEQIAHLIASKVIRNYG